ncbi:hypothetical protein BD410DRAFT_586002 [Rickenella mellea]|uniref:Uncharacterized protein n=1 Tax=Rickenella mellea TaxID=50990 RepID=A0A4Y7PPR9_9AGAM|nr:hypothetical protein BD410DRAFT_586002 [Rickenella mellea]
MRLTAKTFHQNRPVKAIGLIETDAYQSAALIGILSRCQSIRNQTDASTAIQNLAILSFRIHIITDSYVVNGGFRDRPSHVQVFCISDGQVDMVLHCPSGYSPFSIKNIVACPTNRILFFCSCQSLCSIDYSIRCNPVARSHHRYTRSTCIRPI